MRRRPTGSRRRQNGGNRCIDAFGSSRARLLSCWLQAHPPARRPRSPARPSSPPPRSPRLGRTCRGHRPHARRRACSSSAWSRTSPASTPARPTRTRIGLRSTGNTPTLRGNYIIDNNGNYHLDLASKVTATKSGSDDHDPPEGVLELGGSREGAGHVQGLRLHVAADRQQGEQRLRRRPVTTRSPASRHKGNKQVTFHWKKPFADYRDLFGLIYPSKAARRPQLEHAAGRTASAVTTASRSPTARSC